MKYLLLLVCFSGCQSAKKMHWQKRSETSITGSEFYKKAVAMKWMARDSFAVKEILSGNLPAFLKKFIPIHVTLITDARKNIKATYYVARDYLSIGSNSDWARIPMTPYAAQKIADSLGCFLSTRKIADDIYKAAKVKLEPVPMYAFRDSTITMWQHHLIIEGQRKGKKGLVAGIKKDVVLSGKITRDPKPGREAIYGWHMPGGKPIQPLYTGHIYWWVDYSHGIRLVYRKIKVNGKWVDYMDVLKDPVLQKLLCDEEFCDFPRYPY